MDLELLNLELQLIEPWAAGGTFVATAETTVPEVDRRRLADDRARLVLPLWTGRRRRSASPPNRPAEALGMVRAGHAGIEHGL